MPLRRLVSLTLFPLLCLLSMEKHAEAGAQASGFASMPTCRRRCGAVEVPFPFGFQDDDPSCFYSDPATSLTLICNASFTPPKVFDGILEVIDISIQNAKMRTWMDISYNCYNDTGPSDSSNWSIYMGTQTSTFSYTDNIFVAVGCDTKAYIRGLTRSEYVGDILSATYTGGCMSSCESLDDVDGDCSGIGCCQTSIPKNFRGYNMTIESSQNHRKVLDFNPCSYSFLVGKNNYTFQASDLRNMSITRLFPVVFDWYVGNQSCELAKKNHTSYACISGNSDCVNSINGPGYVCRCSPGYEGNPYVHGGCADIDECKYPGTCRSDAICTNKPGNYTCKCPAGTFGDGLTYCIKIPDKKSNVSAALGIGLGISCGLGTLLLMVGTVVMRKRVTKKKLQKRRHKCFKNNHDLLLKQLLLCDQSESIANRIKFFSVIELEKATNKFDSSRIVGDGGHGTVYKGILPDLQVVAIKKSKVEIEIEKEQFINEVILLSHISHRNIVKLIGCCLESEVPLLVYEFISNGTLAKHLHVWGRENPLSWDDRLRIATEISSALAYMHTKANISIYHRDIKSSNILLDDRLVAKVSDFGASKTVLLDQTHVSTNIQGTFGYLDPEYYHTGRLTEKSDVYSLGVILVELITGKIPTSKRRPRDDRAVISGFIGEVENDSLPDDLDVLILEEGNMHELEKVVILAKSCLRMRGIDRPTMKEVELTLEELVKRKKKGKKQGKVIKAIKNEHMLHEESINMVISITTMESMTTTSNVDGQLANSEGLAR